jgi:formylglycine-generating enzyme required for sulfatase activity
MNRTLILAILAANYIVVSPARAEVAFDWTIVGNAGNAADIQTSYGAVPYNYRIATTEVTSAQYAEFLNAVDPNGLNQRGLYNTFMDNFGAIQNTGAGFGAHYVVQPGEENHPVNNVGWYDAARFVNWLHNGQGSGNTETGVYTLLGGTPTPANHPTTIVRNPGARFVLPNEDEWYKAAHHDPYAGTVGSYHAYPTGTNTTPHSDNPNSLNTPDDSNVANFFRGDGAGNTPGYNDGYAVNGSVTTTPLVPLTNVGAYALAASPYGTFDQAGNVSEWTETLLTILGTPVRYERIIRGGSWNSNDPGLGPGALHKNISRENSSGVGHGREWGFRVASLEVPEPTNYTLTVVYQTPEVSGPLIEGFDPLPPTITARILLRDVLPGASTIGLDQVISFDLEIPGDNPTASHLDHFDQHLRPGPRTGHARARPAIGRRIRHPQPWASAPRLIDVSAATR